MLKRSIALTVALLSITASLAHAERTGGGSPNLVQLSYSEEPGAQGHDQTLGAYVKNADAVKFATGFAGAKARAGGKYRESTTDTDINDPEAKHPWVPATGDGHEVVKLVHDALEATGRAKVRLRMKRGGEVETQKVVIKLSECSQDPPLYPVTCEVQP
jgi:hypothetical protein